MTPLRILTVDDEPLALRRLKLLLQSMPYCEHVGESGSCLEAQEKIAALCPDVVLLDIKMRDGSGFDIMDSLSRRASPPAVVFVTAFDQFAVRAFETAIVDYLLKPVEKERLSRALGKARERLRATSAEQRIMELQGLVRTLRSAQSENGGSPYEGEFWVRSPAGLVRVPVETIDCVSSEDEYVAIHTPTGAHLLRSSIRQFQTRVEPEMFVRVHRRWLVRRGAIAELRSGRMGTATVVLRNGMRVPAGRVYLKLLRQAIRETPQAAPAYN